MFVGSIPYLYTDISILPLRLIAGDNQDYLEKQQGWIDLKFNIKTTEFCSYKGSSTNSEIPQETPSKGREGKGSEGKRWDKMRWDGKEILLHMEIHRITENHYC